MSDRLSEGIIKLFQTKKNWKIQTIRDRVSRFKIKECPHATQNAAAHVLALTLGFSCAKKLRKDDKKTLPSNLSDIIAKYKVTTRAAGQSPNSTRKFTRKMNQLADPIERAAWKNATAYPYFFRLENSLRMLILNRMGNDVSWWKRPSVPDKIVEYAQRISEDEKEIPWRLSRGNTHPIFYLTLSHLSKIIQINWSKFNQLGDMNSFLTRLKDLIPIRNSIAHHVPITIRDSREVEISIDKILKIIKNKYH
jgi:hypothetical protein